MGKRDFKEYICRPFCKFYREGQKEDMACRGAQAIEFLVHRGILNPDNLPLEGKDPSLWQNPHPLLEKYVCDHCPFEEQDCDFQSRIPIPHAEPCGGYILLSLLTQSDRVEESDLMLTSYEKSY